MSTHENSARYESQEKEKPSVSLQQLSADGSRPPKRCSLPTIIAIENDLNDRQRSLQCPDKTQNESSSLDANPSWQPMFGVSDEETSIDSVFDTNTSLYVENELSKVSDRELVARDGMTTLSLANATMLSYSTSSMANAQTHEDEASHNFEPLAHDDVEMKGICGSKRTMQRRSSSVTSMLSKAGRLGSMPNARDLKCRASELIVRVPARQLRKIAKAHSISSLQRETQHFVSVTTVNGLLRIYRSRGLNRFCWTMSVFLCFLFLTCQIVQLVNVYLSRPTVSQVSFLLPENGLAFPSVTVCAYNPIRQEHIESLNKTGNLTYRLVDYLQLYLVEPQFLLSAQTDAKELAQSDAEWSQLFARRHSNDEFSVSALFRNASLTCSQVLKICSFGGREFDCCAHAKEVFTDMGKCYQFNLADGEQPWLKRQVHSGVTNGLQIVADFLHENQIDGHENVINADGSGPPYDYNFDVGFRYYVHHRGSIPFMQSEGICVSPGMKVYSGITPTRYILLHENVWGNCTDHFPSEYRALFDGPHEEPPEPDGSDSAETRNDESSAQALFPLPPYTSSHCKTICRAHWYNDNCGCAPYTSRVENLFRVCTPFELYKCINDTVAKKIALGGDTRIRNVEDFFLLLPSCSKCKLECNRHVYHAYNTYARGYSRASLDWFARRNKEWAAEYVLNNFVTINVFYRDMLFTEYRQVQSVSMTEILSDIGGNMGLFLGMSIISLFEAFAFLYKISWLFISRRRREHMLAKKRRDEEREQRLQATLDAIAAQQKGRAAGFFVPNFMKQVADEGIGAHQVPIIVAPSEQRQSQHPSLGTKLRRRLASVSSNTFRGFSRVSPASAATATTPTIDTASKMLKVPVFDHFSAAENGELRKGSTISVCSLRSFKGKRSPVSKKHSYVDVVMEDRLHGDGHKTCRNPDSVTSLSSFSENSDDDDEGGSSHESGEQMVEFKIDLKALDKGDRHNALQLDGRVRRTSSARIEKTSNSFWPIGQTVGNILTPWDMRRKVSRVISTPDDQRPRLVVPSLLMRTLKPTIDAQAMFAMGSIYPNTTIDGLTDNISPLSPTTSAGGRGLGIVKRVGSFIASRVRSRSPSVATTPTSPKIILQLKPFCHSWPGDEQIAPRIEELLMGEGCPRTSQIGANERQSSIADTEQTSIGSGEAGEQQAVKK